MFVDLIARLFTKKSSSKEETNENFKNLSLRENKINDIICNHIVGNASDFQFWINNDHNINYNPKVLDLSPSDIFDHFGTPPGYELDSCQNGWFYDHGDVTSDDFVSKEDAIISMWDEYAFDNIRHPLVINPFEYWAISDELADIMESMPDESFIVIKNIQYMGVNIWVRRHADIQMSDDPELKRLVEKNSINMLNFLFQYSIIDLELV